MTEIIHDRIHCAKSSYIEDNGCTYCLLSSLQELRANEQVLRKEVNSLKCRISEIQELHKISVAPSVQQA